MKHWSVRIRQQQLQPCLLGLLLLCGTVAPAQTTRTADSLAQLLTKAPADTLRVVLLTNLAWEINESNTDEADRRLQEAIELARRLQFSKGEATAWNGLGVVEEIRGNYATAQRHYRKALDLRRQLGALRDVGASLNNLGVLYEMSGRFDSALIFHKENLAIQQQLNDTIRIARAQFNIAGAYQEMGLYTEAQSHLYDARSILEAQKDKDGMAKVAAQLGHIQFELDQYAKARVWYEQELKLREALQDPGHLAEALTDYANALDELDSSNVAIGYYMRALDIWKNLDDLPGRPTFLSTSATPTNTWAITKSRIDYLRQAEKICLETGDTPSLMETYNTMGDVYYSGRRTAKIAGIGAQILQTGPGNRGHQVYPGRLQGLCRGIRRAGRLRQGLRLPGEIRRTRYQKLNERNSSIFVSKEVLFADEKKQQQIEQQKQAILLQEALLAKSQNRQYALLGGAFALLLVIYPALQPQPPAGSLQPRTGR
jgi:tetratricopeptide (TPR) repeat protein